MRALILISDAYGGHGGIAKFNRDLLKAFCDYPECVEVVAIPRIMPNIRGEIPEKLTYVISGLNNKFKYAQSIMSQLLKNNKFDVIICGHINLLPFAVVAKVMSRAPIALVIHGIDAWQPTGKILNRLFLKYVNNVISVSEITLNRFLNWSKLSTKGSFILPNSFEPGMFTTGAKPKLLLDRYNLDNKTTIMTLGRLVGQDRFKGFDETIDVLPELINEIPNLVYLIVGDGHDKNRLIDKVKSLNLQEHVVFTGLILEEEKADHYRLADAFVMPSRGEGFGIVLLEAMACGIPVLASSLDGSKEALRNGDLGVLVDPTVPQEIINGILSTLNKKTGKVPKELEYFSYENYEKRLHNIISKII